MRTVDHGLTKDDEKPPVTKPELEAVVWGQLALENNAGAFLLVCFAWPHDRWHRRVAASIDARFRAILACR